MVLFHSRFFRVTDIAAKGFVAYKYVAYKYVAYKYVAYKYVAYKYAWSMNHTVL
jgi:hypothetical protein